MTAVFRTPDDRFVGLEGYPFEPHYLELEGDLGGLRMHFVDEGLGDPVVLLHGEPTWSYLYRKMIPALAEKGRVLAPDLIGFGRSDKPTSRDWYSYDRHVDSIHQFLRSSDLDRVTLVVHDWGGPIGLRVAIEAEERIARLAILNTGIFRPGPGWPTPGFVAWRTFAEANPDLPVGMVIQGGTSTDVPPEVIAGYEAPFPTPESKAGVAAFPLLVPLTEDDPGAAEMVKVSNKLKEWQHPTLVAFSDSDPIFSLKNGQRMAERIPGAIDFVPIEGASHFLQEEVGEDLGALLCDFVTV
jgi:haloalkane dehalogenase